MKNFLDRGIIDNKNYHAAAHKNTTYDDNQGNRNIEAVF